MKYQVFEYKLVHAFYYYRNESYLGFLLIEKILTSRVPACHGIKSFLSIYATAQNKKPGFLLIPKIHHVNRIPAHWLRCKLQREGDYSYVWTFFLSVSLAFILDKRLMSQ